MVARVGFYHLTLSPLEKALPALVGKALDSGHRVVVMAGSKERVAYLDNLLWTFDAASWIPHGVGGDGNESLQPVYLTENEENPNGADILILTDGVVPSGLSGYSRCLNLFDGKDEEALAIARRLWTSLRGAGHELTYHQQTERGGWREKTSQDSGHDLKRRPDEEKAAGGEEKTC